MVTLLFPRHFMQTNKEMKLKSIMPSLQTNQRLHCSSCIMWNCIIEFHCFQNYYCAKIICSKISARQVIDNEIAWKIQEGQTIIIFLPRAGYCLAYMLLLFEREYTARNQFYWRNENCLREWRGVPNFFQQFPFFIKTRFNPFDSLPMATLHFAFLWCHKRLTADQYWLSTGLQVPVQVAKFLDLVIAQYKYHTVILLNCDVWPHFLRGKRRAVFCDVIIVTWWADEDNAKK